LREVRTTGTTSRRCSRDGRGYGLHLQVGGYDGWFDISPVVGSIWAKLGGYEEKSEQGDSQDDSQGDGEKDKAPSP
jgi:hypothetical protein